MREFYYVCQPDNENRLPWWVNQLNSFDKDKVFGLKHSIPDIEKYIITSQVKCITFSQLMKKHNLKHINILHIDTEGFDYEIIKTLRNYGSLVS